MPNWCNTSNSSARCANRTGAAKRHDRLPCRAGPRAGVLAPHGARPPPTAVNAGDEPVTLTLPWDGTLAEDTLSHQEFFCGNGLLRLTLEPYGTMLLTQPQE